jgi:hypothetical protein
MLRTAIELLNICSKSIYTSTKVKVHRTVISNSIILRCDAPLTQFYTYFYKYYVVLPLLRKICQNKTLPPIKPNLFLLPIGMRFVRALSLLRSFHRGNACCNVSMVGDDWNLLANQFLDVSQKCSFLGITK